MTKHTTTPANATGDSTHRAAARAFLHAWEDHEYPNFITEAIVVAIAQAARENGIECPDLGGSDEEKIADLAHLFATVPPLYSLRDHAPTKDNSPAPVTDLATKLQAVLDHDEMPQELFDQIIDYLHAKVEAAHLSATIPELGEAPAIALVLAAERARERHAEAQEEAQMTQEKANASMPTTATTATTTASSDRKSAEQGSPRPARDKFSLAHELGDSPLTPEEAGDLAARWIMPFFNDDERIGELLLLLRTLTYADAREDFLCAVAGKLMPYSQTVSQATDALAAAALTEYRATATA